MFEINRKGNTHFYNNDDYNDDKDVDCNMINDNDDVSGRVCL